MSDEFVRKILDEMEQDSAREDSLRRIVASAFEARTRVVTLIVGMIILAAVGAALWLGVRFFQADDIRYLILYATLFNTCTSVAIAARLFLWQLLLRQGVMREIKRLELRLVDLAKNAAQPPATPSERQEGSNPRGGMH